YTTSALSGCSPLSINFTNTSTGQNSNNWNFNNGQSSVAVNASMTFTSSKGSSANTYSVKLVVGNINNCKDSVIKTITLFAYPKAQFDLDTPACSPKLISFTNTSVGGNTYVWDMGTSTSSLNNPSFTFTNGTTSDMTKTVSLVAINSDNCKDTVKVSFVLHPQANFNITSSPDSGCASLRVNFSAIAGVKNYNWSFGDGSVSTNSINSKTYLNNTSSNKLYTAQLIALDANNCSDTIKKVIKVFPKPLALFSSDLIEVVVPSQAIQLTNQSTGASTYSWTFGDGGTSNANSPSYNYQNVGEYVVTLIAVSDKNCKDTFALADKIIATTESGVQVPNAFTPNTSSSSGSVFDPKDKSNDIFHPVIKNVETYNLKIFSRWGELLFETSDPKEGWDGYFRGKLCTQDVYVWKIYAKLMDGRIFDKAGDLNLLIK
ncbi:MAG TPA: PKD domain-containing protein, partial [Bacteroidia bacterium]|nr:PKD domain-containing protein [Bacteroidia bacterium]